MMFLWIILLLVAIMVVWYFTSRSGDGMPWSGREKDPLDVLRERFARGEITEDEFVKRKRILEGGEESNNSKQDKGLV